MQNSIVAVSATLAYLTTRSLFAPVGPIRGQMGKVQSLRQTDAGFGGVK